MLTCVRSSEVKQNTKGHGCLHDNASFEQKAAKSAKLELELSC